MKNFRLVMHIFGMSAWTYLAVMGFCGKLHPEIGGIACVCMALYSGCWALKAKFGI